MTATYKPIVTNDIDIAVAMMRDFYAIDGYPMDAEKSKKLFEHFIANENLGKAWLIEFEAKPIGYVILTFVFNFEYGGTIAFVDELYLSKSARGKGIGTQTMAFVQSEAKKSGLKLLYLEVEDHNANAQKLYLSAGFSIHNRTIMKCKIN